jgi:hypothetical protein
MEVKTMTVYEKIERDIKLLFKDMSNGDFAHGYCKGFVGSAWRFDIITDEEYQSLKKLIDKQYEYKGD